MLRARDVVLDLHEYHPPLGDRSGLRLDFNENTVGASPSCLRRLQQLTVEDLARYPSREPIEREVASFLGLRTQEVLLTNGVDEGIRLLCETYLEPGDETIVVAPTFAMYEICARATGARVIAVPAEKNFAFPAKGILAAIGPRTRMIAIANPNNPTGTATSADALLQIAAAAPQAALLLDEAYYEFFGETLVSSVARIENLFVARTFSKAYGLAGLRVGALAGAEEQMRFVRRACSPYNVNGVALAVLPTALADAEYVNQYVAEVRRGRERLQKALRAYGIPYSESQANFVLANLGTTCKEFVSAMSRRGILVRDRSSDPGCEGHVRITLGVEKHTDRLLTALREILPEMKNTKEVLDERQY